MKIKNILQLTNWPDSKRQQFCILAITAMIVHSLFGLHAEVNRVLIFNKAVNRQDIEYKYAGLAKIVRDEETIGYFTDNDLREEQHNKEFSHAQFALAPTILEPYKLEHDYILFVCHNKQVPWIIMKKIGAEPIVGNEFGMVLARRKEKDTRQQGTMTK